MPEMARQTIAIMIRKISGEPYKQGETIVSGRIIYKESVKEHHD